MPTDLHQRAYPQGLRIISYVTAETALAISADTAVDPSKLSLLSISHLSPPAAHPSV
jgi:hypothetical protein